MREPVRRLGVLILYFGGRSVRSLFYPLREENELRKGETMRPTGFS